MSDTGANDKETDTSTKEQEVVEEPSNGRWTREEHMNFIKGLELHGKGWKKIAALIKTRTVVQIRTHAQKYFLKLQKARNESHGKAQAEIKAKEATKKKAKRPDHSSNAACFPRPQTLFLSKEEVEASLFSFLTPNYPVDMNMEMTGDASTREIDVDLLLREAENLDWASDHSVMDASRAINSESFVRNFQHVSPRSHLVGPQMQLDFSLFTKPEPHESGDSAHTADFPDAQPLLDTNPTTTQKSSAPINFLDLDPFPNLHMHNMPPPLFEASSAGTSEEAEQEQWSRMHVGNMFFGQDAIHADDDIGLYFQD